MNGACRFAHACKNSVITCKGLTAEYRKVAENSGCLFLDAAEITAASPTDEEHLYEQGHLALASAVSIILTKSECD